MTANQQLKVKHLILILSFLPLLSFAQPGSLDPSFGGDGKVVGDTNQLYFNKAFAVQPDGKILVTDFDSSWPPYSQTHRILRYNPDGSPDSTFGVSGVIAIETYCNIFDIALLSDGRIVAAAEMMALDARVICFNTDGSLDQSFGTNGYTIFDMSPDGLGCAATRLTVGHDDQILVSGYVCGHFGGGSTTCPEIVKIITGNGAFVVGAPQGVIDFDVAGFDENSVAQLITQPGGKFLISGAKRRSESYGPGTVNSIPFLAQSTTDGVLLDTTFSHDGFFADSTLLTNSFSLVGAQPDGKILAGGHTSSGTFVFYRYLENGQPDSTFGLNGLVQIAFPGGSGGFSNLHVQADGKIIGTGTFTALSGGNDFGLVRLNGDGTIDSSFGTNGFVTTDFNSSEDVSFDSELLATGGILLAGVAGGQVGLAKYQGDHHVYEQMITACNSYDWHGVAYTESGTYLDTLAAANGADSVTVLYLTIDCIQNLGMSDSEFEYQLKVAPNPTRGEVSVSLGKVYDHFTVRLINADGRMLETIEFVQTDTLELSIDAAAGYYLLEIITSSGQVGRLRIIKE